jgi:hypothetical protein
VDYFGEEVLELHVQLLELVVIRHVFEELAQKLKVFERVHGGVSFLYQNQNQLPIIIIQIYLYVILYERFEEGIVIVFIEQLHGYLDQPEK